MISDTGRNAPVLYLAVALGSALGGALRWLLSEALQGAPGFPWGTLWVNASGSLLIGFYAARVAARHGQASILERLFFMTGFCGGYTTFSIFSLESLLLLQAGQHAQAAAYIGLSVVLWLAGVWAGWKLGAQGRWGAAR